MNTYLIPANSKKSMLIFGLFTKFDLILVSSGAVLSFMLLVLLSPSSFGFAVLCLLPLFVTAFFVIPIPNYHNVMTLLREVINFYYNRRNYKWRGWCYKDEFK